MVLFSFIIFILYISLKWQFKTFSCDIYHCLDIIYHIGVVNIIVEVWSQVHPECNSTSKKKQEKAKRIFFYKKP